MKKEELTSIKVVSLDLWGTLIKGNPIYSDERAKMVQQYCDKTIDQINTVFKGVKDSYDAIVTRHGMHFNALDVYAVIAKELDLRHGRFTMNAKELERECNALFCKYPPVMFSDDTMDALVSISNRYDTFLISNTVLVGGNMLDEALRNAGIYNRFKARFYSDVVGVSKPNPKMFKRAHHHMHCRAEEVLHVGDNETTDVKGASEYGFKAVQVNTPLYTAESNFIKTSYVTLRDVDGMLK